MQKAMDEIRRCIISCQINDLSNTRNKSSTGVIYDLLINLSILAYCKRNACQLRE